MMDSHDRIAVIGTGPAGLIASLCLAHTGHSVRLVGPAVDHADPRTTALMQPSLAVLEKIGMRHAIENAGAPLRVMRIVDGTTRLIRSPAVAFHASDIQEPAFGFNIPNAELNRLLDEAISEQPTIQRIVAKVESYSPAETGVRVRLDNGERLVCNLVIGADGRQSRARIAAGISHMPAPLPQSAFVLCFEHEFPHDNVSTEIHTESGPFTQVPLPDPRRSSLVWVVPPHRAERLLQTDDEQLGHIIEERMQSMLGKVSVAGPRAAFPLSTALPPRFGDRRIVLVGEAAHVFPPIGAQGLNLAVRDIADLTALVPQPPADPGASDIIEAYNRTRRSDIMMRSAAVRSLNRSLLSDMLPAQMARAVGLDALRRVGPLRDFFMREGMSPGSGFKAIRREVRDALREQVDRYRPRPHKPQDRRYRHY
ncbi:UbiH/UbiF family hydroxylase [Notoacmeibacter sp. MSK16QG-6]|uniref:UbiH/UbiF family hydroxylase n=1 Tax=Notoacmeibacter sp. MSK16QG-6 TaxID=2957982 RepID=UPI00209EAEED|nr:UbiH/UbiF family hydroxylase [Notoacmeibacter sp. MSK16QG-6]MCP1200739.1 UbiH/UbiF family hydroxylase [Notoacmeibacter sp. MSK16QG-6]